MTIVAFIALVVALVAMNVNSARVIRSLRAQAVSAKLAAKSDDEDVLAALEAHAATSELAKRLLDGAREGKELAAQAASLAWQHDTKVALPCDEHWKLFWRDYQTEKDDTARVVAISRYLDSGNLFTVYEKVMLIEPIVDEGCRDAARQLLYRRAVQAAAQSGTFRWSKQPLVALVTLTCKCGNTASRFRRSPFMGWCHHCYPGEKRAPDDKSATVSDINTLIIDNSGEAWCCTGSEWIKRTID